jgi:RNA polymerase sigma-70 factor (ECF subfamily)
MAQKNTTVKGPLTIDRPDVLLEHAFKQLHAPLFFYALKFLDDDEAARDLVQDAFLKLLNNNEQRNRIENLKSYLFKTVKNNCLNYLTHKKVENEYQEQEVDRSKREIHFYDTHTTLVEKELQQNLKEAIDKLPEHYRTPFILSRFEELKNKEIAEQLGLPLRTVETQIYRAMNLLRKKFSEQIQSLFLLFTK